MSDGFMRQSPLASLGLAAREGDPGSAGVHLWERVAVGMTNLRGDAGDGGFIGAARSALGYPLPTEPNTVTEGSGSRALWLGPNEWLIVHEAGASPAGALRQALSSRHVAVTDVSDARGVIALGGSKARDVLKKGSPLDVHPRAFGPMRCAQTRLSKLAAIIEQRDDSPVFDICVVRSATRYLWRWLEDAGAEYGIAIVRG
jgi:sarcosine oxidase, subunit gamma